MCLVFAGCGADGGSRTTEQASLDDAGVTRSSACLTDADCGDGLLCEACADGFQTCVPGCRVDAQCGPNMICTHDVQCLTCPCPSGWCDLDPCRDLDGDGYAAALTGTCPGKSIGDCDDAAPSTHPGGVERCANGRDDDCDGRRDANDDACRDSCPGSSFCASSIQCGTGKVCERGCCDQCPAVSEPTCGPNECLLPGGLDARGCAAPSVCAACASCADGFEPVCGKNFATYGNACLAEAAGTTVMHTSECSRYEGSACVDRSDCPFNQVCRETGQGRHCALVGTCTVDADCAAVTSVAPCGDAGVATWVCRSERCAAQCP